MVVAVGAVTVAAVFVVVFLLRLLVRRDGAEEARNRQFACRLHRWERQELGLVCGLCGKVAGRDINVWGEEITLW